MGRIHRLQKGRKEVDTLAPSDMKIFHAKIEQSQKAVDEREGPQPVSTRGRDYYSLNNLVTALTVLWNGQGLRKDGRSFMEMLCISATHNMLLQDEELHQINFSDCFAVVQTQNRQPGAQQCVALTFKLQNSNHTSGANQKLYVSALRHYDVARCTFSAFAFYMFQVWQVRPLFLYLLYFNDMNSKNVWRNFPILTIVLASFIKCRVLRNATYSRSAPLVPFSETWGRMSGLRSNCCQALTTRP